MGQELVTMDELGQIGDGASRCYSVARRTPNECIVSG